MQVSWNIAVCVDIKCTANNDGHDAICLESPRRQTDGLMADGSYRDQQGNIDIVLDAGFGDARCILLASYPMAVLGWDEMESGCETANTTFFHQLR